MSIPARSEQSAADCWNLSSLFASDEEWETSLKILDGRIAEIDRFRGKLGDGAGVLLDCLQTLNSLGLLNESLNYYAFLRVSEDAGDSVRQGMQARYTQVAVRFGTAASFVQPELLDLPQATLDAYLASPELSEFRIALEKTIRFKPHTLSKEEEKLLAMQEEANQTAQKTFEALTDVDFDFGTVDTPEGPQTLSQASFQALQMHPDRKVRENSWLKFYETFDHHKNTLASLYGGSVLLDSYQARVRSYEGSLQHALFPDKVETSVYTNLYKTVREFLPSLRKYYALRARKLGVDRLQLWDTKVSLVSSVRTKYSYEEAVALVLEALAPLGKEYVDVLGKGLRGTWVDRYENKGKHSGAYSAGSYKGSPYILLNYKDTVLRDVFTIAHEGGHSMHSWYSVRNNPFQHYQYSIFEAEVASTFNEHLLFEHLLARSSDRDMKAYLINKEVDDTIATLFRQTMFAEFEQKAHEIAEKGSGLTLDALRSCYRDLLSDYFGPDVELHALADLEGLRIPHFYRAFYVYKYATGMAASLALSRQVLSGREEDRLRYLGFLKSGGSSYPIENLRAGGVDMSSPKPIRDALAHFEHMVSALEELL